jgi:hypothetical protein
MKIVHHDPNYRRTWMFPRNLRKISPWKLAQIVALLNVQINSSIWTGNQSIQDKFIKTLEGAGLKRTGVQYDPHSGGARTYLSQLVCIGLVFKRARGEVYLSIAGEDMAKGAPPLPILQELLFRHQYPSVYSSNSNVKIHPSIKVKPFLFLLELIRKAGHLTNEELVIPVIYGHNKFCIDVCLEKIQNIRCGATLESVIDSSDDLYTPRTLNRVCNDAIADVKHIANTCKNYLEAGCLIDVEIANGRQYIRVAEEYSAQITKAIEEQDEYISGWNFEESFQRKLGCWNKLKDTRLLSNSQISSAGNSIITANFITFAGKKPMFSNNDEFVEKMVKGFGFNRDEVEKIVNPLLPEVRNFFDANYIDMANSRGRKAIDFEKATGDIFKDRFNFNVEHTGQKTRPDEVGGYSDLFLVALDEYHCAIIDTKSSASYALNAPDYRAMAYDYIPSYCELSSGGKNKKLEFCAYVAGGFSNSIDAKLINLKRETRIPVSAITADDLLRVCKTGLKQVDIRQLLSIGRKLDINDY